MGEYGNPEEEWEAFLSQYSPYHNIDAGTTYPNTACEFDDGDEALPFCDPALPTHVRAADLIGRMTLAEQLQQLLTEAPAIP